jgi:hypothetical protein
MGQVLQAGVGQNPARAAGQKAGLPMSVPSLTINKVCPSGLNAIATADQLIRAGEAEIMVAGGMESMTNAPHLLPKSRTGLKYGDITLVDDAAYDGLYDQLTQQAMGATPLPGAGSPARAAIPSRPWPAARFPPAAGPARRCTLRRSHVAVARVSRRAGIVTAAGGEPAAP